MRFLVSITLLFCFSASFGQTGYKIDFKVKGWKDTTVYLCTYYGESKPLKDSAFVNSKGEFTFDGKKNLEQAVYFVVLNKTKIFDFVVGSNQRFRLETDSQDLSKAMKVTGDEDNRLFFDNQLFIQARLAEASPFTKILQDTTLKDEAKKKEARNEFNKITDKVMAYQKDIIDRHPSTITAKIFKSTRQIEVPAPPKKADGTIDSSFQLKYYREHFFDNFDLSDDALIRMPKPFYQDKVKEYLERLFLPQPDTITKAIEAIVAKAKTNKETYKYMVYTCVFLYQAPEIMGLDEVFVNLYNKYFASGEMDYWANAAVKKNLKDYADKLSRAMIGHTGPNLIMQDADKQPRSLYDIKKKYTIIYFFDPDCGHCRKESPKLVDFYNKNKGKYDLEVYAVASDTSLQKLKNYIKEMKMTWITVDGPRSYLNEHYSKLYYTETFPTVYILDEKRKVIARKLPVEKIDEFLGNYEKFTKHKAPANGGKGT